MREVDGIKIEFIDSATYFQSMQTPSMMTVAQNTGADVVLLLAPGKTGDDLSDDDIRDALAMKRILADAPEGAAADTTKGRG